MTLLKAAILVPVFVSGFWFTQTAPASLSAMSQARGEGVKKNASPRNPVRHPSSVHPKRAAQRTVSEAAELNRRLRIEQILMTLDRVAEVTGQMSPERAVALEPVLVDLAEQTLELTSDEAVQSPSTDEELDEIEGTVSKLVGVVETMIEPEMSL